MNKTVSGGSKVLIVDDQAYMLTSYRAQLEDYYEILVAKGAEKGFEILNEHKDISVIVSDVHMPGLMESSFKEM